MFGEHTLGKEMDCVTSTDKQETVCTTTVIKRQVDKIIIHEDFNQDISNGNDIALIRLADPIPLHSENSTLSSVMPICLPWNRYIGIFQLFEHKERVFSSSLAQFLAIFEDFSKSTHIVHLQRGPLHFFYFEKSSKN